MPLRRNLHATPKTVIGFYDGKQNTPLYLGLAPRIQAETNIYIYIYKIMLPIYFTLTKYLQYPL